MCALTCGASVDVRCDVGEELSCGGCILAQQLHAASALLSRRFVQRHVAVRHETDQPLDHWHAVHSQTRQDVLSRHNLPKLCHTIEDESINTNYTLSPL